MDVSTKLLLVLLGFVIYYIVGVLFVVKYWSPRYDEDHLRANGMLQDPDVAGFAKGLASFFWPAILIMVIWKRGYWPRVPSDS